MVALTLQNFGGMIPAADDRLLPDNHATLAQNTWLVSGAVEGIRKPTQVYTLGNVNAVKAFRIPKQYYSKQYMADSYWLEFENPFTDVVRSPSVGDTFERFYWFSPTEQPKYTTKARIAAAQTPYLLGIPAPTVAPTISIAGGVAPTETRAYVYTWVSSFGEEGPPSPPTLATGNANGTWTVTGTSPGAVGTNRSIAKVRFYRTITGTSGGTTFYFVGEATLPTVSFADNQTTALVAANNILESTFYEPPPTDLQGAVALPNGIIAAFRSNEVWFCEPYLPHAWPSPYALAVEGQIVGIGVVGQTVIVLTTGSPYAISGVSPATMAISRMAFSEPCLSRGSIVSTPMGVVYASPNGLAIANPGMVQVITRQVFSKDDWLDPSQVADVTRLRASVVNSAYYAWGAPASGCFSTTAFEPTAFNQLDTSSADSGLYLETNDPRTSYVKLKSDLVTTNCYMDVWTGETLIVRDGKVFWLDIAPSREKETYIWRSKIFEAPNKRNFEAMRVFYDDSVVIDEVTSLFGSGEWKDTNSWDDSGFWYDAEINVFGTARVYADGRLVFQRDMRKSGELMRLPSGFKASYWQIEIEARTQLRRIEFATTAKELGSV